MPFITDEELLDFKTQIELAEEEKKTSDTIFKRKIEDEKESTRKFKIATILLGIIALLGIAGSVYFMNFNTPTNMITKKKAKKEREALETKIAELESSVQSLSMDQEVAASGTDATTDTASGTSVDDVKVYAVQIGAFEEKNLSLYSDKFMNFREIKQGNLNKYALGNFATLSEAKKFRRELVKLGFSSAFIASYLNGKRQQIEEAW